MPPPPPALRVPAGTADEGEELHAGYDPLLQPGQGVGLRLFATLLPELADLQSRLRAVLDLSVETLGHGHRHDGRYGTGSSHVTWRAGFFSARVPEDPVAAALKHELREYRAQHSALGVDRVCAAADPAAEALRSVTTQRSKLAASAAALPFAVDGCTRSLEAVVRGYEAAVQSHIAEVSGGSPIAAAASQRVAGAALGPAAPTPALSNLDALCLSTDILALSDAVAAAADVAQLARRIVHAEARGTMAVTL